MLYIQVKINNKRAEFEHEKLLASQTRALERELELD